MLASQVVTWKAREGVSRDPSSQNEGGRQNQNKPTRTRHPNTTGCYFAEEGQREGGVSETLLHPQISGCYCAAAGCHIW